MPDAWHKITEGANGDEHLRTKSLGKSASGPEFIFARSALDSLSTYYSYYPSGIAGSDLILCVLNVALLNYGIQIMQWTTAH